ncbi:MAG: hypothetical protein JO186_02300 [Actinobacteria bacterium]|nr:hypothetical protein [Actinomycetota bacterium]MBV8396807.1 hypothetical protein [Actinomycetota bacterium]MBV8598781.1 hypothetical protein [Actinomycetota bacterium]
MGIGFARRAALALAGLSAGVLLAGCGATAPSSSQKEAAANAAGLIGQLHDDVTVSQASGSSLAVARRTLGDDSDLLAAFVAYTDFGSCRKLVRDVGATNGAVARVAVTLRSACGLLERGSRLFSAAAIHEDPRALVEAARTVDAATPILVRAQAQLGGAHA